MMNPPELTQEMLDFDPTVEQQPTASTMPTDQAPVQDQGLTQEMLNYDPTIKPTAPTTAPAPVKAPDQVNPDSGLTNQEQTDLDELLGMTPEIVQSGKNFSRGLMTGAGQAVGELGGAALGALVTPLVGPVGPLLGMAGGGSAGYAGANRFMDAAFGENQANTKKDLILGGVTSGIGGAVTAGLGAAAKKWLPSFAQTLDRLIPESELIEAAKIMEDARNVGIELTLPEAVQSSPALIRMQQVVHQGGSKDLEKFLTKRVGDMDAAVNRFAEPLAPGESGVSDLAEDAAKGLKNFRKGLIEERADLAGELYQKADLLDIPAEPVLGLLGKVQASAQKLGRTNPKVKQLYKMLLDPDGVTPITNTGDLHVVKLWIDDQLEKTGASKIGRLGQRAFKEAQADLVAILRANNELYDEAYTKFKTFSKENVAPFDAARGGKIVEQVEKNYDSVYTAAEKLFKSDPAIIKRARENMPKEEFDRLLKSHILDTWDKANPDTLTAGGKFWSNIAKSPRKRKAIADEIGIQNYIAADDLFDTLRRTARAVKGESGTLPLQMAEKRFSAGSKAGALKRLDPRTWADAWEQKFIDRNKADFVDMILTQDGAQLLEKARQLKKMVYEVEKTGDKAQAANLVRLLLEKGAVENFKSPNGEKTP